MKTIKHSLLLALLTTCVLSAGARAAVSQIEITEIRNVGVSAATETHSIIQVSWTARGTPELKQVSFEVYLEAIYADGFLEKGQVKAAGSARTVRFEVPTVHRFRDQPAAEIKSFKVSITGNYSETTTKQVSP